MFRVLLSASALSLLAAPALAATYKATVLADIGGEAGNGYAHGINAAGDIVGSFIDAILWSSNGTPNVLPNAVAGQGGVAEGINSKGL